MDELITLFNAVVCALLALALGWAVLSPRVDDGVVIKIGLISMALGFAATAWALADGLDCSDVHALGRAESLINGGLMLSALGWAVRALRSRDKERP